MSMPSIIVTELRVHPVKGLRGDTFASADVEFWGLKGDRRWMVVDQGGRFMTQREYGHMALIKAENTAEGIILTAPGLAPAAIPVPGPDAEILEAVIWKDRVRVAAAGPSADAWISTAIGVACRLVYLADTGGRAVDPDFATRGETVNLADGFPVLLTSLASLADLNARLATPIPMGRFRPTIVVNGAAPWEEDCWRRIRIGGVAFSVVKPCDRCIVTTIDPETGLRPDKTEPLRTLSKFRRDRRGGVMFGQNLIPETTGTIKLGDQMEVLELGETNVMLASDHAVEAA